MDSNNNDSFNYTYSAEQRQKVEKIRSKYIQNEEAAIDRLQALDKGVTKKGTVVALVLGILGSLIMGVGMCLAMVWYVPGELMFGVGIFIGIIGIALVASAYPLYSYITEKERERIAPEIIRLSDELLK